MMFNKTNEKSLCLICLTNFVLYAKLYSTTEGDDRMGYRIKEARLSAGMSQEELSAKSGVSRTIISGLESGRLSVTTTGTIKKIADALGKKVSEIFFDECV